MKSQELTSASRRPALNQNEQNEATAFDRLADQRGPQTLRTSDWTFSRYRSAVAGRPIYQAYPDLVFTYIGKHFFRGNDPDKPLKGLRVFDLGAGDGLWSVILADQGADVTSVEISPRQVELARERMRIHDLVWDARIGSAYCLRDQFPAASYDLIFAEAVLHHLTYDLTRVYDGMYYLLREGGLATMTEPYSASPRLRRLRERLSWVIPLNRESPDERPLDDADLLPLRRLFSSVTVEPYNLFAKLARRIFRSGDMERALFRVDRFILQKKMFRRLAGGIFVAVQK